MQWKCDKCNKNVGFISAYIKEEKTYCKDCYDSLWGFKEKIMQLIDSSYRRIEKTENPSNALDFIDELVIEIEDKYRT